MDRIKILYEDDDILALNKPSGISVHHDGKDKDLVITDWLVKKFPNIKKVGEPLVLADGTKVDRPGIVHRLDKETSGVLLVAKTQAGYEHLKSQFKNREIKKTYHAFIYGRPKDERGMIDKPIGREAGGVRRWATGARARGEMRDALTRYKVVRSINTPTSISLLEIWPQTGRTHQIRVHMRSIGHPIIADPLYAPARTKLLGFRRLALHASRIVFTDLFGRRHEVEAPFGEDFQFAQKGFL